MSLLVHVDGTWCSRALHVYFQPLQFSIEAAELLGYDFEFLRMLQMLS